MFLTEADLEAIWLTIRLAGHEHLAQDPLTPTAETILDALDLSAQ